MHDKTSHRNFSNANDSYELKAYTTALIKAVLYEGDDIEEYLPEVKRLAFKHTADYAAFEFNLSRFVELYRNCQTKNKFNEPNMLALNNLCSELGVEPDVLRISNPNNLQISEGLKNFIKVMVDEIVLDGKAFDEEKKKWLKKYCEEGGEDFIELEKRLGSYFQLVSNLYDIAKKKYEKGEYSQVLEHTEQNANLHSETINACKK